MYFFSSIAQFGYAKAMVNENQFWSVGQNQLNIFFSKFYDYYTKPLFFQEALKLKKHTAWLKPLSVGLTQLGYLSPLFFEN